MDLFLIRFNETLTFFLVFPAIVSLGLYLTFRLRGVQLSKLKLSFYYLFKKEEKAQGTISHYQAVSAVLAGNFGTGNISGMAVALTTGGPGALVWMWIMAFLGASIQYASCILGVIYREKNSQGEFVGGPMYYLQRGLNMRALALLFSCFTLFGAFAVGNFAQVNSVVLPLAKIGLDPFICSLFIAAFVAAVLLGGIKRVAWIASFVVPFKAALYLGVALLILALNADKIVPALSLMIHSAFDLKAAAGGAVGFSIVKAISSGFDRGLFATDAGTGVVPILQSSAKTSDPVIDGLTTLVAPFLVMIVCTTTGLVLLVTGTFQEAELQSTNMVTAAFERGLGHFMGSYIVIASLLLFAYTTILAWACCAERAAQFLFGEKGALCFKGVYILLIPVGALLHVDLIWRFADISISLMLIANLIGVARLSPRVIAESKRFFSKIPSTD